MAGWTTTQCFDFFHVALGISSQYIVQNYRYLLHPNLL